MVEVLIQSWLPAQLCPTPLPAAPEGPCRVHLPSVVHCSFSGGIMNPHGISSGSRCFSCLLKRPSGTQSLMQGNRTCPLCQSLTKWLLEVAAGSDNLKFVFPSFSLMFTISEFQENILDPFSQISLFFFLNKKLKYSFSQKELLIKTK